MIKAAKNSKNHWASYTWTNPATKKVERKIGYSVSVDNTWWLGSGLYESEENK
jgi:signal transduction histidine kinase